MNNFEDQIAQITETVINGVKDTVANVANAIAEDAKQNTTADIADSISTEIGDDGLSAKVSANSKDAAATEYGSHAKPFMNPAFEKHRHRFLKKLHHLKIKLK